MSLSQTHYKLQCIIAVKYTQNLVGAKTWLVDDYALI